MAKIEVTSTTDKTLTVTVSEMSSIALYIEFYIDNELDKYYTLTTTSKSHTYTGLEPETEYKLSAIVYDANWDELTFKNNYVYGTTDEKIPLVEYWSWTSSNGSASTSQTRTAYEAITGKGKVSDFNYLVWNDLIDKIYEVKQEAGYSWNTKYSSRSATKMSSSDKTLTAVRFNSARYNIGIHVSTGIDEVSTGDTVYGWYFETLTDCLNEWIDSL